MASATGAWSVRLARDLAEGVHLAHVTATDAAGNVSPPSEGSSFTVDTVPPEVPEVSALGTFIHPQRPDIVGTAEPGIKVTVSLDGDFAGHAVADEAGAWRFTPDHALAAGSHFVQARATDKAGNDSPGSEARTFDIILQKSHYGWSCGSSPAFPATWALLVLASWLGRRRRG
jgi:uncharacterized protein (TIGR03382 family)